MRRSVLLALATSACSSGRSPSASPMPRDQGERRFVQATFAGNGRTCATCHDLGAFGTLTPERARALFTEDPGGPLFRPLDSDDGLGRVYDRLRAHATIRVPIDLAPDPASGLAVRRCDAPSEASVVWEVQSP